MSKKILLVEDEALIAMSEAQMLKKHGYEVFTANTGEKAVEAVDSDPDISLILMDIDLGKGMDGPEAAEKILEKYDLPVVFLSSHTEPEVVEKTEGITSYGYIVKNSGETVLIASIKMAFRLYEAHRELKRQKENLNTALIKYEQTAEELADKSDELEHYFRSSLDMLCIADTKGRFIRLNPEWEKVLGYSVAELEGQLFLDFVHPEDREATLKAIANLKAGEDVTSFENRLRSRDGSYCCIEWRSRPIGSTIYSAARDITDRKRAEETLLEREALYRNLMENSIDGVELLDEEGNFLNVNQKECEMLGYSREELLTMKIADIDLNYPEEGFYQFWKDQPKGSSLLFETFHRHKDGSLIPVEVNGIFFEVNQKKYLYGVSRDISERRQLEEKLRESEQNYRFIADNVQDIVWLRDMAKKFPTYVSPSIENVIGYTADEVLSMGAEKIHTRESYARQIAVFTDLVERGLTTSGPVEHEVIHKDGHTVPIEVNPTLIWDEAGKPKRIVSIARDISARKQVEAELEAERSLLRNVLHNTPGGLFVKDRESRFITANPPVLAALGVDTVDEIIGRTDFDFFSKEFAEKAYAAEKNIIATGKPLINEERPDTDEGGTSRWILVNKFPFVDEKSGDIKGVIGTWYDITENRRQRERLKIALQELNHRVKNNLFMVSSLIDLKASILGGGIDLSDVRNQVTAIAKVHESLQASDDISHMSLRNLVMDILSSVFHSTTSQQVTIKSDIPDISVQTKTAVPLGLIINEIATNALQHGFTAEEEACFTVALEEDPATRQYVLTISNSGQPFPEDTDMENPRGLGLQLVSALVAQLQGTIEIQRKPQPLFTIRFYER